LESIRELRQICQGSPHVKNNDTRHAALVARRVSIYFTWLLLHTPISANQTTLLFIVLGICASAFFVPGDYWLSLAGAGLLQVWFVFDCVDGEIARYRKSSSVTGSYFDLMAHDIVNPVLFGCLSYGVYNRFSNPAIFAFGLSAAVSLLLIKLTWLNKVRTLMVEGRHCENPDAPAEGKIDVNMIKPGLSRSSTRLARYYKRVSFLFQFPAIMNILCIATILGRIDIFLFVYGTVLPAIWIAQVYRSVTRGIVN